MTSQNIFKLAKEKGYMSRLEYSYSDEDMVYSELYLIKKWLSKYNIHLNVMYITNKNIGIGYIWGIIESPESDEKSGLYHDELDALIDGLYESLNILK